MSTVAEVGEMAPALAIDRVIRKLVPEGYEPDRIMLSFKDSYANVSDIVAQTPKPVLQAFMLVRVHEFYSSFMTVVPTEDRATDVCFKYMDTSMPWLLSKFFLDAVYSEKHQEEYTTMAETVKDVFIERVEKSTWLSEESRSLVAQKTRDVQLNVGYPEDDPDTRNATALKAYYDGAEITTSWFSNALTLRQWAAEKTWDSLLEPTNRLKWLEAGVHAYSANARAGRENNMMMMPASLLLPPYSSPDGPAYLRYGRVAYIAAHEIAHNFDNIGLLISHERTSDEWLSEDSKAVFAERADCVVEQYSRVPVEMADGRVLKDPETNRTLLVNGTMTLSENIADQAGLSIAYEAWKRVTSSAKGGCGNGTEQALPGLDNFTSEQLFFISFGQSWCSDFSEDVLRAGLLTNEHAPGFARTRITPANVEGFKQAFRCEKKSPECPVW